MANILYLEMSDTDLLSFRAQKLSLTPVRKKMRNEERDVKQNENFFKLMKNQMQHTD